MRTKLLDDIRFPRVRLTQAYAELMVQKGGSSVPYQKWVGLLLGGEVTFCTIRATKERDDEQN